MLGVTLPPLTVPFVLHAKDAGGLFTGSVLIEAIGLVHPNPPADAQVVPVPADKTAPTFAVGQPVDVDTGNAVLSQDPLGEQLHEHVLVSTYWVAPYQFADEPEGGPYPDGHTAFRPLISTQAGVAVFGMQTLPLQVTGELEELFAIGQNDLVVVHEIGLVSRFALVLSPLHAYPKKLVADQMLCGFELEKLAQIGPCPDE